MCYCSHVAQQILGGNLVGIVDGLESQQWIEDKVCGQVEVGTGRNHRVSDRSRHQ